MQYLQPPKVVRFSQELDDLNLPLDHCLSVHIRNGNLCKAFMSVMLCLFPFSGKEVLLYTSLKPGMNSQSSASSYVSLIEPVSGQERQWCFYIPA